MFSRCVCVGGYHEALNPLHFLSSPFSPFFLCLGAQACPTPIPAPVFCLSVSIHFSVSLSPLPPLFHLSLYPLQPWFGLGTRRSSDKPRRLSRPLVPPGASSSLSHHQKQQCAESRPAGAVDPSCGHQRPGSKARNVCFLVGLPPTLFTPISGEPAVPGQARLGGLLFWPSTEFREPVPLRLLGLAFLIPNQEHFKGQVSPVPRERG